MNIFRVLVFGLIILLSLGSCNNEKVDPPQDEKEKETHHPFLIVRKDQFQALREKADEEPWKSMKEDAISRSNKGSGAEAYDLQYYVGAAALAYIVDVDNAQTHANRVRDAIINKYAVLEFKEGNSWGGVVPPMGSTFVAILALDIVYDALTIDEISACEEVISSQISKINREGSWGDIRYGTHGTWDIYKGDRTTPDDNYFEGIMHQITDDGVSPVTNHYAWERVGGGNSRISKSGYMDVLEFTGIDPRYYTNEKLQKFHRWLFGSSVNCAKEMAIFGDMLPTQGISNDMLHRRVVNFDMEAAGYAAWFHEGRAAYGNILTYIIPKEKLPSPVVPSSKIYANGGAFFREDPDDADGLHAVLYNIKSQDEWHTHQEVNGLALSGYGNRLLVNGGRLGAPTRPANLNNTLTVNGDDHSTRVGDGIVEGFAADGFDYASGHSGAALGAAEHLRNLILMHGADNANPYFILFDEVAAEAGIQVKNYLHPANQTTVTAISAGVEYNAAIDHYPTIAGAQLTFFYATPPENVAIEKVASAVPDRYPGYPDHNRLESVYTTNAAGRLNVATVLMPTNTTVQKPPMTRISESDFSGCRIDHEAGTTDILLTTAADREISFDNIIFHGKAVVSRMSGSTNVLYFVRKGTKYSGSGVGFESDAAISIYVKQNKGVLVSDGAKIKLLGQGMNALTFDPPVTIIDSGDGFIEVQVSEGTIYFE